MFDRFASVARMPDRGIRGLSARGRAGVRLCLCLGAGALSVTGCKEGNSEAKKEAKEAHKAVEGPEAGVPEPTESALPVIPGFDPEDFGGRERAIMDLADPTTDRTAWSSEAISAEAGDQLKALAKLLGKPAPLDGDTLAGIVAGDFSAAALVPPGLAEVYRDAMTVVERAPGAAEDVLILPEVSEDALTWFSGEPAATVTVSRQPGNDGTETVVVRDALPLAGHGFARLRVTSR